MTIAPGNKLSRYEFRSKIGAGGMGDVYLAEDTSLHRQIALKILPEELASNRDRMRRLVQEIGERDEALKLVDELKGRFAKGEANGYDLARVYVGLGDGDQVFAWLEKDFQLHNSIMRGYLYMSPLSARRSTFQRSNAADWHAKGIDQRQPTGSTFYGSKLLMLENRNRYGAYWSE